MNSATSRDRAAPPEKAYLSLPPKRARTFSKTSLSTSSSSASSCTRRRWPARSLAVTLSAAFTICWTTRGLLDSWPCTAV